MRSRRTLLEARLAIVRRDLEEVTERLSPDLMGWAPATGMRTVAGQLVEIAGTELQLVTLLRDDRWVDDDAARALFGDCDDLTNLRRALIDVRRSTLDYLGSLPEADLAEEVGFGGGWFGSLGLPTIPRAEVFVSIADHEWYHVGQLTSYLWTRGIDPYA